MAFLLSNLSTGQGYELAKPKFGDPATFGMSYGDQQKEKEFDKESKRKDEDAARDEKMRKAIAESIRSGYNEKINNAKVALEEKKKVLDNLKLGDPGPELEQARTDFDKAVKALEDETARQTGDGTQLETEEEKRQQSLVQPPAKIEPEQTQSLMTPKPPVKDFAQSAQENLQPYTGQKEQTQSMMQTSQLKDLLQPNVKALEERQAQWKPEYENDETRNKAITQAQGDVDVFQKTYDQLTTAQKQDINAVAAENSKDPQAMWKELQDNKARAEAKKVDPRLGAIAVALEDAYGVKTDLAQKPKGTWTEEDKKAFAQADATIATKQKEWIDIKGSAYNPQADNFYASQARAASDMANAENLKMTTATNKDKGVKDVVDEVSKVFADYKSTNADYFKSAGKFKAYSDAFTSLASVPTSEIASSPPMLAGLVKAANKLIESDAAVMSDDVSMMLTTPDSKGWLDGLLSTAKDIIGMLAIPIPKGASQKEIAQLLQTGVKENKISPQQVQNIINLGTKFQKTAADGQKVYDNALKEISDNVLNYAQLRNKNALAFQNIDVKTLMSTPEGQSALKVLVNQNIPAVAASAGTQDLLNSLKDVGKGGGVTTETKTQENAEPKAEEKVETPVEEVIEKPNSKQQLEQKLAQEKKAKSEVTKPKANVETPNSKKQLEQKLAKEKADKAAKNAIGTQTNPISVNTPDDVKRSVKVGQWFKTPNGQVRQRGK
jgi:hypothetical protein